VPAVARSLPRLVVVPIGKRGCKCGPRGAHVGWCRGAWLGEKRSFGSLSGADRDATADGDTARRPLRCSPRSRRGGRGRLSGRTRTRGATATSPWLRSGASPSAVPIGFDRLWTALASYLLIPSAWCAGYMSGCLSDYLHRFYSWKWLEILSVRGRVRYDTMLTELCQLGLCIEPV
jgi:hypothetical protein